MRQAPFIKYLLKETLNRQYCLASAIACLLQFTIFKFIYPFPDFTTDSFNYIYAASAHLAVNINPVGYSKFLEIFHALTHSDIALMAFQYFLIEFASLYFFFTLLYFYKPAKSVRNLIFCFLFFNPLFLYISNYVTSDPLFLALSILWMSELLWITNQPRRHQIITQAILLYLCFIVGTSAFYYPFISALSFALSNQSFARKIAGVSLPVLLIGSYAFYSRTQAERLTGFKQFSLYTGWQLANNVLYIRGNIPQLDGRQLPSKKVSELDTLSRIFYNEVPKDFDNFLSGYPGNFFIQAIKSPLQEYFSMNYTFKDQTGYIESWGKSSIIFRQYGTWIIKHYPITYLHKFIFPNAKNYLLPSLESLEIYNLGNDEIAISAEDWFDFKIPDVACVSKTIQGKILAPFPYLFSFLNVLSVCSLVMLILRRKSLLLGWQYKATLILMGAFLVAHFCFCVFTTVIVIRNQLFPMIVTLAFSLLLIQLLDKIEAAFKSLGMTTANHNSLNIEPSNL